MALLPLPSLAVDRYVPATHDEPALYPVGSIVRLRCDGGSETKFCSIYASERDVGKSLDSNAPLPKAARSAHRGTRLRVLWTRQYQSYTPISHTKLFNYQGAGSILVLSRK
jgi:hypothetical protein